MRASSLLALALLALGACYAPTWTRSEPRSPAREAEPAASSTESPRYGTADLPAVAPGWVAVRLEGASGRASLELEVGGERIRVERRGHQVTSSRGELAQRLRYAAVPGELLVVGDRAYHGELWVLARGSEGLTVLNLVPMEDYVRGVVASELAIWSAPPELLEAQAIAARSYALAQLRGRPGKAGRRVLSDSVLDQAYAGEYRPGSSAAARAVAERLELAVEATRDLVLVTNGRVLDARFHASCGGRTASFESVFSEPDPGSMTPVACDACHAGAVRVAESGQGAPSGVTWEWTANSADLRALAEAVGIGTRIERLIPIRRDDSGRWLEVRVSGDRGGRNLGTVDLRRHLGFGRLKSAWIVETLPAPGRPIGDQLVFLGRGRGHGVGLCQTGARELAERGWSAARILREYFSGAGFSRLGPPPADRGAR